MFNLRKVTVLKLQRSGTTRLENATSITATDFQECSSFLVTFNRNPSNGITSIPPI